jgi:undecaprenyl diphosphate synthase
MQSDLISPLLPLPCHIAIIMDGNGRWAQRRGLARFKGHYQGVEALKRTIKACQELEIKYLTVYAFSTENWSRPQQEINVIMELLRRHLRADLAEVNKNNIRLRVIGSYQELDSDLVALIEHAIDLTQNNTGLQLSFALNYGSRAEITRAAKNIAYKVKNSLLNIEEITQEIFSQELFTSQLPDPDLLIRTSNENRLSNYLLWQLAYTELVFVETYWPDFKKDDLINAIAQYQSRERRFGDIAPQAQSG